MNKYEDKFVIDEKLGRMFRMKLMEIKGNKRGAVSEAIEEAIRSDEIVVGEVWRQSCEL